MWQKVKNYFHLLRAIMANVLYGFPSRKLTVIGVTGTDGKTTTTSLIYHILRGAGKKVAMITSIGAYIGENQYDIGFHVTTPSPFGLQKYIRRAADAGNEYLVLETTSHALDQYRVWGIDYRIGVLTNITHEHLDYHKTYREYVDAKLRLLLKAHISVVNMDDASYEDVKRRLIGRNIITYSLTDKRAVLTPQTFPFKTQLIGDFNKQNSLAATGAVRALGIDDSLIKKGLATFQAPQGRQEVVYDKDFRVIVDFAHTPNAFAKILPEIKKITKGKLVHVFGSAGKRDATKRPEMGLESAKYSDTIILTSEDPRDEKIEDINNAIRSGIKGFTNYDSRIMNRKAQKTLIEIPDRKEAIEFAISQAGKGDTVFLTGKSHEKSINYGYGEEPWDEFKVVRDALRKQPE